MEPTRDVSCSVEETNRIRASLGLKPLRVGKETERNDGVAKDVVVRNAIDADTIRERILESKEGRLLERRFRKNRVSDEKEEDVNTWIARSRNVVQSSKRHEASDDLQASGKPIEGDLRGLSVRGLEDVREGEDAVFTLKDRSVLDEEEDELEMFAREQQRAKEKALDRTRRNNPFDEVDETKRKGILQKYDEEEDDDEDVVMRIGTGGLIDGSHLRSKPKEGVREKLSILAPLSIDTASNPPPSLADASRDFYTAEEASKLFKPKKKKRKLRKRRDDRDAGEDDGSNHPSTKNDAYPPLNSVSLENKESTEQNGSTRPDEIGLDLDSEEDDAELQASLARARQLAFRKEVSSRRGDDAVLQAVRSNQGRIRKIPDAESGGLVLNEVEEFVAGIQVNHGTSAGAEYSKEVEHDVQQTENGMHEQEDTKRMHVAKVEPSAKEEATVPVSSLLANEQHVGKGISGALAMLKQKGELKPGANWSGRTNDKKAAVREGLDSIFGVGTPGQPEVNITYKDEFGRVLTPKEAFRELCYNFHGIRPSKNKREKRLKQYLEEIREKQSASTSMQEQGIRRGLEKSQKAGKPAVAKPTSIGEHKKVQFSLNAKRKPEGGLFGENKAGDKRQKVEDAQVTPKPPT